MISHELEVLMNFSDFIQFSFQHLDSVMNSVVVFGFNLDIELKLDVSLMILSIIVLCKGGDQLDYFRMPSNNLVL